MDGRVNLKQVAAAVGVSIATVSNALLGKGRVSAEMRERICRKATEMGYSPDPIMRALCHYRRRSSRVRAGHETVALLVPSESMMIKDRTLASKRLMDGMVTAGDDLGIKVELFQHEGTSESARQLSRILYNRGIKGVVLSFPRPYERDHPNELQWENFAVVACNPLLAHDRFHSVGTDHFRNGRMLYRKLVELGYSGVGLCISEDFDILSSRALKAGVWAEMQKHTAPADQIPFLVMKTWEFATFRTWFEQWRPEVILSQRRELIDWIRKMGYRVPQDVGVAVPSTSQGYYNSGIDQNLGQMGEEALRLLWEKLIPTSSYGIPDFPLKITIPAKWNVGKTLR
ncbi:MAG: LacI family transcriptional regulator [Verrucomicrobia bacterium]|nr:LacI family transcriptional regulator [Verrucomicrobiota bacterium]